MVIAAAEFDDLGNCSTTAKLSTIATIYSYVDIKAIESIIEFRDPYPRDVPPHRLRRADINV
jgi:hypothetical protein